LSRGFAQGGMVNSRCYLLPTCQDRSSASRTTEAQPPNDDLIAIATLSIATSSHTQWLVSSERSSRRLSVRQFHTDRASARQPKQVANRASQPAPCGLSTSPVRLAVEIANSVTKKRIIRARNIKLRSVGVLGALEQAQQNMY
jgi:hypothetical protein